MYSNRSGRLTAFAIFFWFAGAVSLEASPMTVEWDANSEPDLAGYVVYYGTASGVYIVNVDVGNQTSWQVNLVDGQSYYFAVQAYDSDGLYSVFSNEVSAVAGEPFLTNPGDQSDAEGTAVTLALAASDPDGDTLSYSAPGLPPGLSLDAGTGDITGTVGVGAAAGSPYSVTASVSDGGLSSSVSFTWTVSGTNQPPAITSPGNQSTAEGTAITLALVASDPDGDTLSYSATGLPPDLSVDAGTGDITGTVNCTAATGSPYSVTASVSDGALTASTSFTWTVSDTNRPPVITSPGDQSDVEGTAVTLALVANDPDGDTLSYSATSLPPGLSLDASTGNITGTVSVGAAAGSPYSVTASVSDGVLTASTTFTWTVSETNQPPVIMSPGDQSDAEGTAVTLALVASDPDGDTLSYSATGLPPGLSLDASTGNITGTVGVTAAAGSPYSVTASASDGLLSASTTFTWTVSEDQGPVSLVLNRSEVRFGATENGAITTGAQGGAGSRDRQRHAELDRDLVGPDRGAGVAVVGDRDGDVDHRHQSEPALPRHARGGVDRDGRGGWGEQFAAGRAGAVPGLSSRSDHGPVRRLRHADGSGHGPRGVGGGHRLGGG